MNKLHTIAVIAVAACLIVVTVAVMRCNRTSALRIGGEGKLTTTATQIDSIRSIGQWEFLSIADEELVDTVRHGFFGDDRLARIYYGTLRIGIDMSTLPDDWMKKEGDSIVFSLPSCRLLDDDFIDEARTRSFIEEGKWTEADRAALTRKAAAIMRRRCLTPANINRANANARAAVGKMIEGMGADKPQQAPTSPTNSPNNCP